ncbi:MAG: glycogen synthase [Kiritimatiellae bacterium]|nr:glycogen synthase [Kiritimatiellia bacterium]
MYIVHIASECAPVAKAGGLADVVFGLARELEIRGHSIEIILPKYDCMRYGHIYGLQETYRDLWVPWDGGAIHCTVWFGFVHGRKCFFIDPHSSQQFFNRGLMYGAHDDDLRFAFFSRAAMEFLWKSGKHPDVIHIHDWQAGLVPVLLYDVYAPMGMRHPRVCFTLHNLKHQGVTGRHVLHAAGLHRPEHYLHFDRLGDPGHPGAVNLMRGGIVYSNFVTTVSPHYAWEVQNTDQGFGLNHLLWTHSRKFGGVLNGVDYEIWNPEIDPHLAQRYGVDTLDDKYANKTALRHRLLLREVYRPIVAFIGRLDHQKGVPLIRHALHWCAGGGAQFVLLGSGNDPGIQNEFHHLKRVFNDNPDVHLELGFDEDLAHLIYAGADLLLVPSLFEPCGLTQLIALRYGTIPIVRAVGGLADTIFDADFASKPYAERNGYVFNDFNNAGIESALVRAVGLWDHYPKHFRELMENAMRYDYSWNRPGQDYVNIYELIRDK